MMSSVGGAAKAAKVALAPFVRPKHSARAPELFRFEAIVCEECRPIFYAL